MKLDNLFARQSSAPKLEKPELEKPEGVKEPIVMILFNASGMGGELGTLEYEIDGQKEKLVDGDNYLSDDRILRRAKKVAKKHGRPVIITDRYHVDNCEENFYYKINEDGEVTASSGENSRRLIPFMH